MRPLPAGLPWLTLAVLIAVAVPTVLLIRAQPPLPEVVERGETVVPASVPGDELAGGRRLFLDPLDPAKVPAAEDAPKLIGIAGRLPDNAIAMVRAADGTSKVLSPGESHDGWTLESLAPDAALFTRGTRRVRSFLPAAEPEPTAEPESEEP
ncbi:MAG: hypothetical protein V4618_15260 [Pseudomonadota bacterium]